MNFRTMERIDAAGWGSRKKTSAILFIVLTVCMLISGCATTITQTDLLKKMQEHRAPVIVDVRSRGEYDSDHLPGAVHIPFYSIGSGLKELKYAKNEAFVLYCEHGPRAGLAGLSLYLQGYEQVFSLEGHMKLWRANGLPTEKGLH
ncbi:MAG: rhodanese-like domain-containing protein [Geobacteraceae bacterium]|nr:rhodanese-like domain-containing protein [Geobacteraceae bacterium]